MDEHVPAPPATRCGPPAARIWPGSAAEAYRPRPGSPPAVLADLGVQPTDVADALVARTAAVTAWRRRFARPIPRGRSFPLVDAIVRIG
ncbi:MAG TPA: hypothetical protein VGQ92_11790 [Actinoplanes sp.]|nr:hypothetical protein [Actinoplanes sp.]